MRTFKGYFIVLITVFINNYSFSQLSGTYTIGGAGANYATVEDAITAINNSGIIGSVIFNINPGTYVNYSSNVSVGSAFQDSNYTVLFESATLDSASVTLSGFGLNNPVFNKQLVKSIALKELTLTNTSGYVINDFANLNISNCIISSNGTAINGTGRCSINNSTINGSIAMTQSQFSFVNSIINGSVSIDYGDTTFISNSIVANYITADFADINLINNSIFDSAVQFSMTRQTIIQHSSFINGLSVTSGALGTQIYNSTIGSINAFQSLNVGQTDSIRMINNQITGTVYLAGDGTNNWIVGNRFNKCQYIALSQTSYINIIGNKFIDCQHINMGYDDNALFENNFFSNCYVGIQYSNNIQLFNNNFSLTSQFQQGGCTYTAENNNFSFDLPFTPPSLVAHNNFYPLGSLYDKTQTNYDPEYFDSINLYTTNPLLAGNGIYVSSVKYDIDSTLRPNPPTIGANEICFKHDTIVIALGDTVILVPCGAPKTGTINWFPNNGLNNASLLMPKASPSNSTMYVLKISPVYLDSIYVKVIPYSVIANNPKIYCGDSTYLYVNYNPNAIYQWSPTVGLASPNSWHTMTKPNQTTTYTVSATIPGISNTTSSAVVTVLPNFQGTYTDTCLTVIFNMQATCATSYNWNFGDGTFSDSLSPSHAYAKSGTYLITFIACNSSDCDSTQVSVSLTNCALAVNDLTVKYHFNCYPNPTDGNVKVTLTMPKEGDYKLSVSDVLGRTMFADDINITGTYSGNIDMSGYSKGIYFISVKDGSFLAVKKVVVY